MFETTEGDEHELLAEGEVLQQQLIAAERAVTFGPQAVLVGKAPGRKMRVQWLALLLRQARVQRLHVQGQRLVQGTGQRRVGIEVQRQAAEVDLAPVGQLAAAQTQPQQRTAIRLIGQAHRLKGQRLHGQILGGGVTAAGALRADRPG